MAEESVTRNFEKSFTRVTELNNEKSVIRVTLNNDNITKLKRKSNSRKMQIMKITELLIKIKELAKKII